jgi:hypothetical protein
MSPAPPLHESLAHVAMLLGSWSGTGHGEYPTIEPFRYTETITFGHVGKPFLAYGQRTRALVDGSPGLPLHAESGYWRFPSTGRVEVVIVHPTGVTEIEEGTLTLDGGAMVVELATSTVGLTATAKSVAAVERSFRIEGDRLDYTVRMAAVGLPLQHHLAATLYRDPV